MRQTPLRPVGRALSCTLLVFVVACAGSTKAPSELADGSPARPPPVPLEGVDRPAVLTRARLMTVAQASRASADVASCVRAPRVRARDPVILRTGVYGASVTSYATRSRNALIACDGTGGGLGTSCGTAYGRLRAGRLLDPRLDLAACPQPNGHVVAFAWIDPERGARFVTVRHAGFVEVYPATGGLPIRVATTSGVDLERSRATFEVSEHDPDGRLLRAYELRTSVAG